MINIWADVICPFCYLGSVWAEEAARELHADLRWLPFEIHPETPPEGAPKPVPPDAWPQVRARLGRFAEEAGLPIDPPERNVNSPNAPTSRNATSSSHRRAIVGMMRAADLVERLRNAPERT